MTLTDNSGHRLPTKMLVVFLSPSREGPFFFFGGIREGLLCHGMKVFIWKY